MGVPEAAAKLSRMDFKVLASRRVGEPISVVSSTNWVWERGGLRLWMDMPCRVELWMAAWMVLLRPSAIRMKRNGESGSPYQIPLEGLNVEVGEPLRRMEKKEEEMREYIHWIQLGWKPKAFRIFLM